MSKQNILDGVRVLDFSRYIAGPYCATLLAYLGADVIRVEKPGGSEDRWAIPITGTGEGALIFQTGCNKRSLTVGLGHDKGQEIVRRLVATADVVICNLPPAGLKRLGLDYENLKRIKPDIILTTQTAFGHQGPWAEQGGFDGVGQAMSGAMYFSGTPGAPARSAVPYADYGTACLGAFATLAALYQKRDTGQGQHVQTSLLATSMALFGANLIEQGVLGIDRRPSGNRMQTSGPSDVFPTSDGFITVHTIGRGLFARIARLIGAEEWLDDPRLQSDHERGQHGDELSERVGAWCAARTTDEALSTMHRAGVPCSPVHDLRQALDHPQVAAMGLLGQVEFPGLPCPAPVPKLPVSMSGADTDRQRRPPIDGEHTDEILTELGYSRKEITELKAIGAC